MTACRLEPAAKNALWLHLASSCVANAPLVEIKQAVQKTAFKQSRLDSITNSFSCCKNWPTVIIDYFSVPAAYNYLFFLSDRDHLQATSDKD